MLKFSSFEEMFAWRAKFAPKSLIKGENGKYVLEKIELEVTGHERSNQNSYAVPDVLEDVASTTAGLC